MNCVPHVGGVGVNKAVYAGCAVFPKVRVQAHCRTVVAVSLALHEALDGLVGMMMFSWRIRYSNRREDFV